MHNPGTPPFKDGALMSAWMWAQGWRPIEGVGWRRIHEQFEVIIPHAHLHGVFDHRHPDRLAHFVRGFEMEAVAQLSVRQFDWHPAVAIEGTPGLVRGEAPAESAPPPDAPSRRVPLPWMAESQEDTVYAAPPCWWCGDRCTIWRAAKECRSFEVTCLRRGCGFAVSLPDRIDPREPAQVVAFLLVTYGPPQG